MGQVSKQWKPGKNTVELNGPARPSRIRREPPPRPETVVDPDKAQWSSNEREIWLAIVGIVLFALAINAVVLGVSANMN